MLPTRVDQCGDIDMVFDSSPQALSLDTVDERRLVIQARAGHRLAREELAMRIRRPAYLLALQIVGNQDDALDIAQDAMLRLFEHLGRFRPEHAVRP